MTTRRTFALFVYAFALSAATATAQPLGTFRWQLQPYCNIIAVTVTQQAGIYTLDGTDDRCGASQKGSVVGIAFLNPDGSVGFGLTSVLPNGTPIHLEATINLASLNGTWRDSAGNNGTMIFTPGAGIGGVPRPLPPGGLAPASITNIQIANNAVTGANIVDASITTSDILDAPRSAFAGGDGQFINLTTAATVIRSVTINAPAAGNVIVNASAFFDFGNFATLENARCEITTATTIDNAHALYAREASVDAVHYVPFATTRGFTVAAGSTTFNLVCDEQSGTVGLWRSFMTAMYTRQ